MIRTKWFTPTRESCPSASTFVRAVRGWSNDARRLVGGSWLRSWRRQIQASGRSVVEGLGIPADNSQLHTAGLAVREAWYRGSCPGLRLKECPVPPVPRGRRQPCDDWVLGPHWAADGAQWHRWQREYVSVCEASRWLVTTHVPKADWCAWWEACISSGREVSWLAWKGTTKRVHRMGYRRLNLRLRPPEVAPLRKGKWMPRDVLATISQSFLGVGLRRH